MTRRRALALGAAAGGLRSWRAPLPPPRWCGSTLPRAIFSRCRSRSPNSSAAVEGDDDTASGVTQIITAQPAAQRPVRPDRSRRVYRNDRQRRHGAAFSRLAQRQCAGARDRTRDAADRRAAARPNSGCGTCSPASSSPASNISPRRTIGAASAHIISDAIYEQLTGNGGYFDSRIVFVDETGPAERAHQAARHHGSGRRQRALSDARRRTRAHAAVFALDPGDHLYGLRPGRSPRLSLQYRYRAARSRRQFSRHELFAAVLAGRPERHHESAGGRELQHLRHGFALEGDDPADQHARRSTPRRPIRPTARRFAFESDRGGQPQIYVMAATGGAAQRISFGDGSYSTPVWSPRGDYIAFTKIAQQHVRHRRDEAGRQRRTHPHRGLPQRRPDFRAQRAGHHVLPRSGRQRPGLRCSRSTFPAATSSGFRRRAMPPIRHGRRCCREPSTIPSAVP